MRAGRLVRVARRVAALGTHSRSEDGQAIVESALLVPLLLLLLVNTWDFGFVFYDQLTLTDAAYQGARMAGLATRPDDDVRAAVRAAAPRLVLADSAITITRPVAAGEAATVAVSYRYTTFLSTFSVLHVARGDTFPIVGRAAQVIR